MSLSDKDKDWGISGLKDRKVLPKGSLSDKIERVGKKDWYQEMLDIVEVRESVREIIKEIEEDPRMDYGTLMECINIIKKKMGEKLSQ